ncbi:MAG TPA: hypothetical protein VNG51_28305 [Ktedonobacteraceae bacterium]|nr:hypothetical protein [Ktedonobacteraceae bacterium]
MFWDSIFTWITSHMPQILSQIVTWAQGVKTLADSVDSVKKLAPEKLETKEVTVNYTNQTLEIMNDEKKTSEERQWEVNTRKELIESLVKVTAIEASYNIARFAIFTAFTAFIYRTLVYAFKKSQK